jgi:hypothetical protein
LLVLFAETISQFKDGPGAVLWKNIAIRNNLAEIADGQNRVAVLA